MTENCMKSVARDTGCGHEVEGEQCPETTGCGLIGDQAAVGVHEMVQTSVVVVNNTPTRSVPLGMPGVLDPVMHSCVELLC